MRRRRNPAAASHTLRRPLGDACNYKLIARQRKPVARPAAAAAETPAPEAEADYAAVTAAAGRNRRTAITPITMKIASTAS
jgi:hypothetical protein